MKKIILVIISLVILLGVFTACSSQINAKNITSKEQNSITEKKQDIREVVYNQLNQGTKDYIKGTWKDSTLRKITLRENMGNINDTSYIGKEVYIIDFKTKNDNPTIDNMIVYASIEDYKIVGYGNVE